MYISEFGSYSFGKKPIYHMIPHAMRVPKMYILSMLEILKIRTALCTLFTVEQFCHNSGKEYNRSILLCCATSHIFAPGGLYTPCLIPSLCISPSSGIVFCLRNHLKSEYESNGPPVLENETTCSWWAALTLTNCKKVGSVLFWKSIPIQRQNEHQTHFSLAEFRITS